MEDSLTDPPDLALEQEYLERYYDKMCLVEALLGALGEQGVSYDHRLSVKRKMSLIRTEQVKQGGFVTAEIITSQFNGLLKLLPGDEKYTATPVSLNGFEDLEHKVVTRGRTFILLCVDRKKGDKILSHLVHVDLKHPIEAEGQDEVYISSDREVYTKKQIHRFMLDSWTAFEGYKNAWELKRVGK